MLTDEQFSKLMSGISDSNKILERLARIETLVSQNNLSFDNYRQETAVRISEAKESAKSAHERIDGEVKARLLFAGAVGAIGLITAFVTLILRLTGKI